MDLKSSRTSGLEIGLEMSDNNSDLIKSLSLLFPKFCFKKAFEQKKNCKVASDGHGQLKNMGHRLFLLRDSSTMENTEDIKYFMLSYANKTLSFEKVERKLCGYDSKTRNWIVYKVNAKRDKNNKKIGTIIEKDITADSLDNLIKSEINRPNILCIKPGDHRVCP